MTKKKDCCRPANNGSEDYQVESIVSVDDRGQMVLPKDVRELLKIRAGEKLALVVMRKEGRPCCIHLFKADELADRVKSLIGPLMEEARRA